jgi:ribosomal protein S12 methylthiotransferase accessory factor
MRPTARSVSGIEPPVSKLFRHGTHRLLAPEETVARAGRFMPVMGITRIANVTGLDRIGIPVVMVCRPNARSLAVAQGKGLDLALAKASGLMEAVEAYHAEHITLPLKLASYEELRYTHRVADVTRLPRVSSSRFHPDLQILWIEGHDLLQDDPVWIPYELVHTDYTLPLPTGSGCFTLTSTGLASGNHRLEAVSHGICEAVERDATTLWHAAGKAARQGTRIDLTTIDEPTCREVLGTVQRADVAVAVWETSTDVGIPSFRCALVDRQMDRLRLLYPSVGTGCHPARHIALLRALTEAAQSRLTFIAGSRDDAVRSRYERSRDPDALQQYQAELEAEAPARSFRDVPSWNAETFDEDIAWELGRLRAAGFRQVIVVDLTKPEFGLPVVRVVIPGLEGSDHVPGYALGARARALLEGTA